jgi:hypothetical protein
MASTILSDNGVSSGSAGLKSTADSTGVLALQTTTSGGAATTAVTIDTSQRVGIGNSSSSPTSLLYLRDTNNIQFVMSKAGVGGFDIFNKGTSGTELGTVDPYPLILKTNDAEKMRIDSSGNVGIGVTPSAWNSIYKVLQVGTSSISSSSTYNNATFSSNVFYNAGNSPRYIVSDYANIYGMDDGAHTWFNAPSGTAGNAISFTQAMTLDSSGNLSLGTTSVSGGRLTVKTVGSSGANAMQVKDSADNIRMELADNGYIRFPAVYGTFTSAAAANVYMYTDGGLYRSTSSLKYKKNVANSTHGLIDLLKLRPVTYEGKAEMDSGKTFGGLIAEEVHDAGLTEFVQYAEDGSPDALAYGNMVSICIKAIQELKAINDQQAETINALTARIVALEK